MAILACGLLAAAAGAEPIASSRGSWAGRLPAGAAVGDGGAGKLELRVEGNDSRFSIDFSGPAGVLLAAELQPGARKGVYEPPPPGGLTGLMAFFGRSTVTSPLEGKPLVWARRAGDELIVYRLEVQGGPHRLDRIVLTPAGNRLELAFERRAHDRPPERFSASLERRHP